MKKRLMIFLLIFIILVIIKYFLSNYSISYEVNNYNVDTIYKDGRVYFEINDGKHSYNFDYYAKRKMNKYIINDIKKIEDETFNCIYPVVNDIKTYPLCYVEDVYTDYNLIDSPLLDEYKNTTEDVKNTDKNFNYYNNLDNNEYIALWNYKGYIVMNGNGYRIIDMFKKDKYDNSLSTLINNKIFMPNNDQEHEFDSLVSLDLTNYKTNKIKLGYNIDYDSYIVGVIGNNLYLFDNKYSKLYEINTKKEKVKIIGNNEKGFVKYENNKFVSCSKTEYRANKITYNDNKSIYDYEIEDNTFKTIKDNINIKQKILNDNITIIKEKDNNIYYQLGDYLYYYNPLLGSKKIFYYYELKFNNENTIFVYVK